jgi:hypothetical protein
MALPLIALAAKLLPFASAIPEVMRAFGSEKSADAAQKVVSVAQALTGQTSPEDAVNAIINKPELQLEFQKALIAERVTFARIEVEDRMSARDRDKEFIKAGRWNFRADLMIIACVVALIYIVNEISGDALKAEVIAVYNMAIGALLKMLGDAFAFEFGSSRGSKEKDELMSKR